jgi:hypothetical protein
LGFELKNWLIQMKSTTRIEGMNKHFIVGLPRIKSGRCPFGNQTISFNTTSSRVVPSNHDFSGEEIIAEPDLVFGNEPVRVMAHVELSIGLAGRWRCDLNAGNICLDVPLPC